MVDRSRLFRWKVGSSTNPTAKNVYQQFAELLEISLTARIYLRFWIAELTDFENLSGQPDLSSTILRPKNQSPVLLVNRWNAIF